MKLVIWQDVQSIYPGARHLEFTAREVETLARAIELLKDLRRLDPPWSDSDYVLEWLGDLQDSITPVSPPVDPLNAALDDLQGQLLAELRKGMVQP